MQCPIESRENHHTKHLSFAAPANVSFLFSVQDSFRFQIRKQYKNKKTSAVVKDRKETRRFHSSLVTMNSTKAEGKAKKLNLDHSLSREPLNPGQKKHEIEASLMQPVQPMLAQPCKSIDVAFEKCPNGVFAEIKYDGERVQLHKQGRQFKFYSRSLKPVLPHKVRLFQSHIPTAFPGGSDMILDAEVLLVDNNTGMPLPFGTFDKHEASGFKDATPCLFVFDIMFYNGETLMNQPMKKRRELLESQMVNMGNNVKLTKLTKISSKAKLGRMIKSVLDQGLEGLLLKDASSLYEPGKRHWLMVKKDYLVEEAMANTATADLVVLGGWFGTGNKVGNCICLTEFL